MKNILHFQNKLAKYLWKQTCGGEITIV